MAESTSKLANMFWPAIVDRDIAKRLVKQGFWAALIVTVVTAVFAALSLAGVTVLGIGPWAFVDAGLFAVIAIGVLKESRVAAVAGFVLFVGERVFMWLETGKFQGWIVAVILAFAFLNAARATFALRSFAAVTSGVNAGAIVPK